MRYVRAFHKWLGLILIAQLILWAVSGTVFAWLDHSRVRATSSVRQPPAYTGMLPSGVIGPEQWLHEYSGTPIQQIELIAASDGWYWRIATERSSQLRSVSDGKQVHIDEAFVRRSADARYAGPGALRGVTLEEQGTLEMRGHASVWRASYDDPDATSLYFSAQDGAFLGARTDHWRWFDLFWMLHTMDYGGRDDFNNPLIITVGTAAAWFALSGLLLLVRGSYLPDLRLLRKRLAGRNGAPRTG